MKKQNKVIRVFENDLVQVVIEPLYITYYMRYFFLGTKNEAIAYLLTKFTKEYFEDLVCKLKDKHDCFYHHDSFYSMAKEIAFKKDCEFAFEMLVTYNKNVNKGYVKLALVDIY